MRVEVLLAIVGVVCAPRALFASQEYFVATTGDDGATGDSWDNPLRTITEAVKRAGGFKATTVRVAAGVYDATRETFPVVLAPGTAIIGDPADRPMVQGGCWRDGRGWICSEYEDDLAPGLFVVRNSGVASESVALLSGLIVQGGGGRRYCIAEPCESLSNPKGAVVCVGGTAVVRDCTITWNAVSPGITCTAGSEVLVEDCDISVNGGGIIAYEHSMVTVRGCYMHDGNYGGAIVALSESRVEVEDCIVERNTGGAFGADRADLTIRRSSFVENTTDVNPSGISFGRLRMEHVLIARNWGTQTALRLSSGAHADLENVTIVDNVTRDCCPSTGPRVFGPQIFLDWVISPSNLPPPVLRARNCIFWRSTPAQCPVLVPEYPWIHTIYSTPHERVGDVSWSCVTGGYPGLGNTDMDPGFVDIGHWYEDGSPGKPGTWVVGDYHLASQSACIDAGDPASGYDPDGTRVDMGAYYFPQTGEDMFIRGDVNRDVIVNLADAIGILRYVFVAPGQVASAAACDANDDGRIDIADAISLLGYLFAGGPNPRPPFPFAGRDATP